MSPRVDSRTAPMSEARRQFIYGSVTPKKRGSDRLLWAAIIAAFAVVVFASNADLFVPASSSAPRAEAHSVSAVELGADAGARP